MAAKRSSAVLLIQYTASFSLAFIDTMRTVRSIPLRYQIRVL